MHPRNCDGTVFEMISGTLNFAFRQNSAHGGQPIAIFNSLDRSCQFFGNCSIPNFYNSSAIDGILSTIYNDVYLKTYVDGLITTITIGNYHIKAHSYDIDNELSTLISNTYTKHDIDTCLTQYYDITYLNNSFDLNKRLGRYVRSWELGPMPRPWAQPTAMRNARTFEIGP